MPATHELTKDVTRTASGRITWASKKIRDEAILAQLKRDGYTVNVSTELLGRKYYISRSASVVRNQIERAFATDTQLNKYRTEWNRYSHDYDTIRVVHRDSVAARAADYLLGL